MPVVSVVSVFPMGSVNALPVQETEYVSYASSAAFDDLAASGGLKATGAFPFDYQFLAFAGGRPDAVVLLTTASVHAGRVRGVFDGGWRYALSLEVELTRDDSLVASGAGRVDHVLNSKIPSWVSDGFPLQTALTVPPGEYEYRLTVRDLNWPPGRAVNVREGELTVPAFADRRPVISSVAVAADSGGHWDPGTWTPTRGIDLKLNAAAIVARTARPFVYYEVYGLTPGGDYRGEVRLVSTYAARGQAETYSGPAEPFQMQYRGTVPADPTEPVRAVMRLDMEDTQPGPYEVQVRVTDMETGERSDVRRAKLRVREIDDRRRALDISEVENDGGNGGY